MIGEDELKGAYERALETRRAPELHHQGQPGADDATTRCPSVGCNESNAVGGLSSDIGRAKAIRAIFVLGGKWVRLNYKKPPATQCCRRASGRSFLPINLRAWFRWRPDRRFQK